MEKDRSARVVAIVALCVAVVGLSIGFSAFSRSLIISSAADVHVDDNVFQVQFSSSSTAGEILQAAIVPDLDPDLSESSEESFQKTWFKADNAEITADTNGYYTKIGNLKAHFTKPGETVTYTFYVHNTGELDAFLNSVTFGTATAGNIDRTCTVPSTSTATNALVQAACEHIHLAVNVGGSDYTGTTESISDKSLIRGAVATVVVTISYDNENGTLTNGVYADGDFDVAFGDITLKYDSLD